MRSTVYVRNFESTLRALAERGHEIALVADPHPLADLTDLIGRLCREHSQIHHGPAPAIHFNAWSFLGQELRRAIDYLRYLDPEFAEAPKLRQRGERNAPNFVVSLLKQPLVGSRAGRWLLGRALHCADRAVPRDPTVDDFIRSHSPDLVLVTPLVEPGSPQAEYLRSARALGIRTGVCVYSWDNLTNKGLIHDPVDLVTVWNGEMKKEAVVFHKVPAARVVVTGAAAYDHWFTWRPRASRQAFCLRVGLPEDRPYLLYVCSSRFIAPNEVDFVRRWLIRLREASAVLCEVGVLVRPHPQNAVQWEGAEFSGLEPVAVWPRAGASPDDEDSRADYYDSIHHATAVVGVNTSAQIESAIVGRGVYTLLSDEFRDTQEGTLHFRHLRTVNGGLLHVARTFTEHVAQLEAAMDSPHDADGRCRRFVEAFVRPHGVEGDAAFRLVSALEATAALGPAPRDRGPWWAFLMRPVLARTAARFARGRRGLKEKAERRERIRRHRKAALVVRRAELAAVKREAEATRTLQNQLAAERLAAERLCGERRAAQAYERYLRVRDRVRLMRQTSDGGIAALTDAERQMLAGLAHLWDAGPETIANLRRWCEPISGVRASDYEAPSPQLTKRLRHGMGLLRRQGGRELLVQEPPILGAFSCNMRGEHYNEDTLRASNVLVALQDGAVLEACRSSNRRRLVWEIGGGWGGLAYQFKTICPNVTYLITSIPDQFLVSAVYLMTAFPDARCRFHGERSPEELWRDWEDVDFIFAPESALVGLRPPQIDLTLDAMALQGMDPTRVWSHVQHAFDFGSRYFYSFLPGRPAANEAQSVWTMIERRYWPNPVPPREDMSPTVVDGALVMPESDYAHLVGWRRLRV